MSEDLFSGTLTTKRDELNFFEVDVFPNSEGNVCIYFEEGNYLALTPLMAKKLNKSLDEAIRASLAMVLSQE